MKTALSALAAIALLASAGAAQPQCNARCLQTLRSTGAPQWDVQRNCCQMMSKMAPNNTLALSRTCVTPGGNCAMLQATPLGTPCSCNTASGMRSGQAR